MSDNNEELFEGTYSLEEHRKEEEIDNNPVPPEMPINYYSYMSYWNFKFKYSVRH